VEIAKVLRRFPWMAGVVKQRPKSILHPCMIEVYIAKDGSEACLSLNPPKAYCAQNGAVKEVKLELAFSRYETYEDKRDIPPQGTAGIRHGDERIRKGSLASIFKIPPISDDGCQNHRPRLCPAPPYAPPR
jgi:hypothetical protein